MFPRLDSNCIEEANAILPDFAVRAPRTLRFKGDSKLPATARSRQKKGRLDQA